MNKILYVVRHCKAVGQQPDAPLTAEGLAQADQLADQLADVSIERIISSPFLRATQSIAPLARRLELPIATDERLAERVLSDSELPDWMDALQSTFEDLDRRFQGGESSRAAMQRAAAVVREVESGPAGVTLLVTHGNLMTLLLKHFDPRIGFEDWRSLTNPDIYRVVALPDRAEIARVWHG
ncbi:MAG TPA: histidine phosphatase family protein [Roseiflexaceae bacterium]|nr:histidine phosphatase family protein [Roseiflexaceae bacterium]